MIEESRIERQKRKGESVSERQRRKKKEKAEKEANSEKEHAPFHLYDKRRYENKMYEIPVRLRNIPPEKDHSISKNRAENDAEGPSVPDMPQSTWYNQPIQTINLQGFIQFKTNNQTQLDDPYDKRRYGSEMYENPVRLRNIPQEEYNKTLYF